MIQTTRGVIGRGQGYQHRDCITCTQLYMYAVIYVYVLLSPSLTRCMPSNIAYMSMMFSRLRQKHT